MHTAQLVPQITARRRKLVAGAVGLSMLGGGIVAQTTFPDEGLKSKCLMALGADLSQPWQSWNWVELPDVRWDEGITITQGSQARDSFVRSSHASLRVGNNDAKLSRGNPLSEFYGLIGKFNPVMLFNDTGTGFTPKFHGFTSDLPKLWRDRSAVDSVIDFECRGPLDHIKRNQTAGSPLTRYYRSTSPSAWWPMESGDERATVSTPSAVAGVDDLTATNTAGPYVVAGAVGGAIVGPPGADRAIDLSQGGMLSGNLPAFSSTATAWRYEVGMIAGQFDTGDTRVFEIHFGDYRLSMIGHSDPDDEAGVFVNHIDTGTGDFGEVFPESVMTDGSWHLIRLDVIQDGVQANIVVHVDDVEVINANTTIAPYANPFYHEISPDGQLDGVSEAVFWVGDNVPADSSIGYAAFRAHAGEMLHERASRVCAQDGIPFFTNASESAVLGPQPSGSTLQILEDGVKADGGDIYEYQFGLALKSLSEYMNQPVSLTLDIAQGHVINDLRPTDSTQNYYNQWTVVRASDNASATEQVQGGVPNTEPVFGGQDIYNLNAMSQLSDMASWLANRDAADLDRWPEIKFSLAKHPELIYAWEHMPFGGRFLVNNMMNTLGYTTLNLHMMGSRQFWNSKQYEVTLNGVDATYFDVGYIGSETHRVDSNSSELYANMTDSQTDFDVITHDPADHWERGESGSNDEFPFDILIGGEAITVTEVGNTLTDTFTRSESASWGTTDTGELWTNLSGTAADVDVDGDEGTIVLTDGTTRYMVLPDDYLRDDVSVLVCMRASATATGGPLESFINWRLRSTSSNYRLRVQFTTTGTLNLTLQVVSSGVTSLGTAVGVGTYTPGSDVFVRLDAYGTQFRAKLWTAGDEPDGHMVAATDSTFITANRVGLSTGKGSGNSNTDPVMSFDDFQIINPARFTGTRAVNGITKAHTANRGKVSEVHVRYPIRLTP